MNHPSLERTADERWAVSTLRRSMAGVEPDVEALLAGVVWVDGRRRRRLVVTLVAAAVVVVLVGLGAVGLSTARTSSDRLAGPAGPPSGLSSPAPGPSGSLIDAHTAALYLIRLTGGNVTDQYGQDDDSTQVEAHLSFDGHTSRIRLGDDGHVTTEPVSIAAADVSVTLDTATRGTTAPPDPDGVLGCTGKWLTSCRASVPGPGQALVTGVALTANGCCAIRGEQVSMATFQRQDGVVVTVAGRSDMFDTADVTRIATSPLWDVSVPPSPGDAEAAAELTPWAAG
ncbi:hypothetical protein [uncultured Friedmanniella sp.]|uniref:hypothetical protein n=1 Tax=uncultured Friedmanniella sp. TaxID=335381 RepID=UPI0035CBD627